MSRLADMGFEAASVERSVATPVYNHEHACYQMVRAAVLHEHDGRASTLSLDARAARARAANSVDS